MSKVILIISCILLGTTSWLNALSTTPSLSKRLGTPLFRRHFPTEKLKTPPQELVLTYLEINGFLMTIAGVTILIDPILEGSLDFGIPDVYTAKKKNLSSLSLCDSLPPIDCILITQGLDDHAHVRTLKKLAADSSFDHVPIVAPLSARSALEISGLLRPSNVRFLQHGRQTTIGPTNGESNTGAGTIQIKATSGALVGPPWQTRENGYTIRSIVSSSLEARLLGPSVYIEPHVEFNIPELQKEAPIDVVITPIVGQRLPILDLVYGPEKAVTLIETLRPKVIVPMPNSNIDQSGPAALFVSTNGSESDFFRLLKKSKVAGTKVQELKPGQDETIEL